MSPDFNVQRFFYSGYIQNFGGAVWEEGKRLNVEITRSLLNTYIKRQYFQI